MGRLGGALGACALALAFGACPAAGAVAIPSFSATPSFTQAGAHPDLTVDVGLGASPAEAVDKVLFEGPPGLTPLPQDTPSCTDADFAAEECSPDTQVGVVTVDGAHEGDPAFLLGTAAVYVLTPEAGQLGRIGFVIPTIDVPVSGPIQLQSADRYRMRLTLRGFSETSALQALSLTLWGVPALTAHDGARLPKATTGCPGSTGADCGGGPVASGASPQPYFESPTSCPGSKLPVSLTIGTFEDPSHTSTSLQSFLATSGCRLLTFDPMQAATVASTRAHTRTGLDLELLDPQSISPDSTTSSQLRAAVTAFDGGLRLDETTLEMASTCTAEAAGIEREAASSCPAASQLGTAEVDSPLFASPATGGIYYGGPNAEGGFRLYLTATASGVDLKIPFLLEAIEEEGHMRLLTDFAELPQLPLTKIAARFSGGNSSPLVTAPRCGEYEVEGEFSPWNEAGGAFPSSKQSVATGIDGGPCPTPATKLALALDPTAILADGHSVAKATATVTEASGNPVYEDRLVISTDNPGETVSPVVNNGDGTYSALIFASTTAGEATVTATDLSVEPHLTSSARLTQFGAAPLPAPAPQTMILRHPPSRSARRRVTFAFSADLAGSSFRCRLDRRPYRPCASPANFSGLRPGAHIFRVFATGPTGVAGQSAAWHFTIRRPRKH